MLWSSKLAVIQAKRLRESVILVLSIARRGRSIDCIIEIRVWDVELPWRDLNNGSVLVVQLDYLESILTSMVKIIVCFIPGVLSEDFLWVGIAHKILSGLLALDLGYEQLGWSKGDIQPHTLYNRGWLRRRGLSIPSWAFNALRAEPPWYF